MTAENIILNATEALRPLRNEVGNFFLFEGEVKTALNSIFLKNTVWVKALWNELRYHEFQCQFSSKEK